MRNMSALALSKAVASKKCSVLDAVGACIDRIEKSDGLYNAFTSVCRERALAKAAAIQAMLDAGERLSPLAGVPVAIKDNISVEGLPATCASKMLSEYTPVFDATVINRLERAGMVIVGKLNMDEFAMGGSSETGIFGAVKNPWDISRVAGGPSGGSATAVAAGMLPLTLGSDTGGSIRQPCAFCGVTGIKPTYGSVSRYGLIAYASSMDQIGPIGRNIDDCAVLLSIISGPDGKDGTCVIEKPFEFGEASPERLDGIKIGLPRNYFGAGLDSGVESAVLKAALELKEAGAVMEEFEMPLIDYMIPAYYVIACAEASSNLSRYDGLKYGYRNADAETLAEVYRMSRSEGFGLEIKRRIMLGSFVLSSGYYDAYYKKALQIRGLIKEAYDKLFTRFDMILSPVAPTTAYKLGENVSDPVKMYMGDIYTVSVNLAGLPAVALPCGFDNSGLPIGFQFIGDAFSEVKLIRAARVYQRRTDFHQSYPDTGGGCA